MANVEREYFPEKHEIGPSTSATELSGLVGIKTKYNEDILIGGHTTVWGSTFDVEKKRWGYKCCLCFDKAVQRCLGDAGRKKVLKAREEEKKKV